MNEIPYLRAERSDVGLEGIWTNAGFERMTGMIFGLKGLIKGLRCLILGWKGLI